MNNRSQLKFPSRQRGAVLVVALLMLLVMTVLGVTAMQMSRMEERMAGNSRDINLAFQGAEAGLRDSEERLRVLIVRPTTCTTAPCDVFGKTTLPTDMRSANTTWWGTNGREYGVAGTQEVTDTTRDPLEVVDDLGFVPDSLTVGHGPPEGRNFYRITANSTGASNTAQALLESTYSKRY
ncbi:MAG: PilX N-terminal domain-containing pilus assembly protein [Pseudomonadota bacterium]